MCRAGRPPARSVLAPHSTRWRNCPEFCAACCRRPAQASRSSRPPTRERTSPVMATISAIEAVGEGLGRHLRRAFELSGINAFSCDFKVVGAAELKALKDNSATCAIYLYRLTHNEFTRNQPPVTPASPVTVDLHLLFSLWLDTANHEHTVLGWLLRELSRYPV